MTYITFYLSEYVCSVSGIIALCVFGIYLSSYESMRADEEKILNHFWEVFSYFANTVIFIISGAIIMKNAFLEKTIDGYDWLYLFLFYIVVNIIRFFMIFLF